MSKALYILEYQKNVEYDRWTKRDGYISVTAETYDEAVENAIKRLPKEKGEVEEYESSGGYGYARESKKVKHTYKHIFRLKDCLDENHALFVPNQQNINVDNSNTNTSYSSSIAVAHRSIFG